MKVSPNVFSRELALRYGATLPEGAVLRKISIGAIPAVLNEKGTRWLLDLADLDLAAEVFGLTKNQAA